MKDERKYSDILDDLLNGKKLPESESGYQSIWNSAEAFEYPKNNTDKKWAEFKSSLNETQKTVLKVSYFKRLAIAASFAMLIAGGIIFYNSTQKTSPIEYAFEQVQNFDLKDGSHITLNRASRISTDSKFANKHRDLTLTGEAFFDVKKNKNIPFTIETGKVKTVVTGTKFNIDAYSNQMTTVSLVEGSVKLLFDDKEVLVLKPGESATVNQQTGEFVVTAVKQNQTLSWKDNMLVFENEELHSVIDRLENVLGVKFDYPKELSNTKISTTISELNPELAARILSETLEADVKIIQ